MMKNVKGEGFCIFLRHCNDYGFGRKVNFGSTFCFRSHD